MTKEAFLNYIKEAVDAMDGNDLNRLFPPNKQPDLYTLLEALTGLRGEVKKIAQSSLRLQNEVQLLVEKIQEQPSESTQNVPIVETEKDGSEKDLRYILREMIKLESTIQRTANGMKELPELGLMNINEYRKQTATWQEGFYLFEKQWKALLKSTGMYQTGKIDTKFNPELHEAVAIDYDPEKSENTILETEQLGYIYKEKIIQQAKVVVNKKKN